LLPTFFLVLKLFSNQNIIIIVFYCEFIKPSTFLFQDFIYLGQVNMNQDSLPSFLKIAERLKIKGLCESLSPAPMMQREKMMTPPPNVSHGNFDKMMSPPNVSHGNFENLLPRSPYVQTEPIVSMPQQVQQRSQ
jgi:hypothetical protein